MRWVIYGVGTIVGLAVLVYLFGLTRPGDHEASTRAAYAKPPEEVWAIIADYGQWPVWNPEVKSVEVLAPRGGHTVLNVVGSWGTSRMEIDVSEPPRLLRSLMDAGAFRGSWTYDLAYTADGGTLLTITETGEVDSPLLRAMMLFHDNYASMMAFHRALGARLGVDVDPVILTPRNLPQ